MACYGYVTLRYTLLGKVTTVMRPTGVTSGEALTIPVIDPFRESPKNFQRFLGFSGMSLISGVSGIFPKFRGENVGVFSGFQAVIVCRHLQNGRFSGDDFLGFPEFPEISGKFPKMSGISPGFRGENSGVFPGFQAVIVCKHPRNDRFSGDDFRDFPEFPEFPENFRKIPEISENFPRRVFFEIFYIFLYFTLCNDVFVVIKNYKNYWTSIYRG